MQILNKIFLILTLTWLTLQERTINITAAVQNQFEIYFSYLSYLSTCDYTQPNIFLGEFRVQELSSNTFYEEVQYHSMTSFWSQVENGLTIMALLSEIIPEQYDGYILYNSLPNQSELSRELILYSLQQQNLTFYYTLPLINLHNLTIYLNITKSQEIELNNDSSLILYGCPSINSSNFAYLANNTFLFVCGQLQSGFIFQPQDAINATILNFTQNIGAGSYSVCTNPVVLNQLNVRQEQYWNAMLLSEVSRKQSNLYILVFDSESKNLTILNLQMMEPQISLIINRIWGIQVKKQFKKWMDLFSAFNISQDASMFPGTIVSLFVSQYENIFVESFDLQYGLNYLNVFNSEGQLYWNISYIGDIIYYGSKAIFIYNKLDYKVYFIEVQRPIFTLNVEDLQNTTADTFTNFSITIPCQNNEQLLINYNILWTTLDYPSALIICKDSSPIVTTDVVFGFQVQDKFEVIGPDFQLIVNAPPNIKVTVIESTSLNFEQTAIDIINVQIYNKYYLQVIFITNNSVYSIDSHLTKKTIAIQPCGFFNMVHAYRTANQTYIIINAKNQSCQCNYDFTSCHLISTGSVASKLLAAPNPMSRGSDYIKYITNTNYVYALPGLQGVTIKKNLYGLIGNGYIVSILSNNTVLLVSIKPTISYLDSVTIPCESQNSTNGDIYTIQFYDPYVLLFCQRNSTIYQFLIRKGLLIPQRQIPLYRFVTKVGRYTFFPAFSFVYISVDPIINVYPKATNCCVLRLDLIDFTVSVIEEIIRADDVIAVTNYRTVDVALYRMYANNTAIYVIKAYFPNVWITLQQSNYSEIVSATQIPIVFQSSAYNFGASFKLETIFNLTNINLNLTKIAQQSLSSTNSSISNLKINLQPSPTDSSVLMNVTNYTLNQYLCGPIFESFFYRSNSNMTNLEIVQSDVMMKTKILGDIGIQFMQIINPAKFSVSNLTLNDLIIAVSTQKMYIYDKQLHNIQLQLIKQVPLPQKRCTYYLYTVVNETASTFIANCDGINYNYKSPLLTINYDLNTSQLTTEYTEIKIPLNLRQMYTIVQNGFNTLVVGIIEGPMNAETGQLYICELLVCSALYVSTSDAFLLNYGAKTSTNSSSPNSSIYSIMSIDINTIQIFVNPMPSPAHLTIKPNYTINYTAYIKQAQCTTLRILNITYTQSYNVIACSIFYYYVKIIFNSSSIQIIQKFARYSQCDLEDEFEPSVIFDNSQGLQMILAQCRQNGYMLRLQQYQTINSSTPVIYTGYLQIFLTKGPLGPNCSSQSTSPSKIVPLSTSMNYPVFITYSIMSQSKTRINKFIYMQINGILIDNVLQIQPSFTILFKPFTIDFQYPTINFVAVNQYHRIVENVGTWEFFANSITYINIIAFVVFALANLITFICLVCYLWQKKNSNRNSLLSLRDSLPINSPVGMQDTLIEENAKCIKETGQERKVSTIRKTNRPSQIQMFFIKKK